jgi:cation diffusion facilitator CzcD-associated flavoprotein CzcO
MENSGMSEKIEKPIGLAARPTRPQEFYDNVKRKFAEERDLRLKYRPDGTAQYTSDLTGDLARYEVDPYGGEVKPREPISDTVECLFIGGGFSALLTSARLREVGVESIRIVERASDVGGTWYWNRYPGVACDVVSYDYLPLLDELDYVPKDHYAGGPEIFAHCQAIARKYNLYELAVFQTTVTSTVWDEAEQMWGIETDRGDHMKARFVICANGTLSKPKLAKIKGLETFKGHSFHTSRWDYNIDLTGKTVGIIGTGATAVQAIPELAKVVGQLYVFQRTPSSIDVRDQRETTAEERESWTKESGWAQARRARFARISEVRAAVLANDDYLAGRVKDFKERKQYDRELTPEERMQKQLDSSFRLMEQVRARVDAIVKDPKTAAALKPYYPYGCKRPTFHDEYLPTFNLPHVHLVDVAPRGVSEINERGVVHEGVEYPLDVLIYATGFQWMGASTFQKIKGRGGRSLTEKWESEGTRTFLGLHTRGFPNLFIVTGPQGGGGSFNFTDVIYAHADYLIWMMKTMRERGENVVDVRKDPEDKYAQHCAEVDIATAPLRDCISYYNGEGNAAPGSLAYYGGGKWHKYRIAAQSTLEPYVFEGGDPAVSVAAD